MKYIYYCLFVLVSVLVSCKKNKDFADKVSVEKHIDIINPYTVEFNELTPEYKLKHHDILENFYNNKINDKGYSGAFLVAKNGEILFEEYNGYSNLSKKERIDENTPMHVASVGKIITSVAVLRLVDNELLDLDQSVKSILSEFPYDDTTVRMLLNHRSGLKYYGYFTADKNIWNSSKTLKNQDVFDIISKKKVALDFSPNKRFAYSNTNYVILALIIEKITEESYSDALKELIFDPLGMNHTFVFEDVSKKNEVSQSYNSKNKLMPFNYLDGTYGDKNIYTTVRDLLKFDKALYSDNFLSLNMKEQMFKGYSYEKKGNKNYGLGMRLIELDNGNNYTFHNGWWRGNTSSYVRLQQDTVSIFSISNKYTKRTYKTIDLARYFGDYPVGSEED